MPSWCLPDAAIYKYVCVLHAFSDVPTFANIDSTRCANILTCAQKADTSLAKPERGYCFHVLCLGESTIWICSIYLETNSNNIKSLNSYFFLLSDAQVDALPEQMKISREFESCRPSLTQVNVFAEKLKLWQQKYTVSQKVTQWHRHNLL